jgi:hypothetical protein
MSEWHSQLVTLPLASLPLRTHLLAILTWRQGAREVSLLVGTELTSMDMERTNMIPLSEMKSSIYDPTV